MPTVRLGVLMVPQRAIAGSPAQVFRSSFRAILAGCATGVGRTFGLTTCAVNIWVSQNT